MKRGMKYLHPGILLRAEVIEAHGLNVTEAANLLHITRPTLSNILNGKLRPYSGEHIGKQN